MAGTVTTYVQPITQPLEGLHTSYTQLASQYRTINTQLRTHANDLLSGSNTNFKGQGAQAFSGMVNYYLNTSEKHMQTFEDAAGAVQTCHSAITTATSSAAGADLNETVTNHVLSQVTHNDIIQRGSEPIWAVINDMLHALSDMAHQGGSLFGDFFTGHWGNLGSDLSKAWGDLKSLGSDAIGLVQDVGHVLGSWADTISSAVSKCMSVIGSIALKVADFVTGFSSMINDIKTIFSGKASFLQKLEAVGDLALNVGMDVSMLFGVGEALKGGELLIKGGIDLGEKFAQDGGLNLVEKEAGALTDQGAKDLAKDGLGESILADPAGSSDPVSAIKPQLEQTSRGNEALGIQQKYNVPVEEGKPGGGTYYSPGENKVYIDANKPLDQRAGSFVHEMNHAEYANTGKSVNVPAKMAKMPRQDYVKGMLTEESEGQVRAIEFNKQIGGKTPAVLQDAYDKGYQQAVDAFKAQHPAATSMELDQAGKKGAFQAVYDGFSQARPSTDPSITYPEYYGRAWDKIQTYVQQGGRL